MRIKKTVLIVLTAFVVASLAAWGLRRVDQARHPAPPPVVEPLPDAVIVYCFHGDKRDQKCKNIERYTRDVLEESLADALKEGRIVWRVVNYEKPEGAHFRNDFQVSGSSIVLVDARKDRPSVAKNLQHRVGQLADKEEEFKSFLRDEIEKLLESESELE